jgi:ABC-2 type transport system permease protein
MTAPALTDTSQGGPALAARRALRAEWTKQRTVVGPAWLLGAAVVLTIAVSTAAAAATQCRPNGDCPVDAVKLSLTGVQLGQAVVAVLAATAVSAEYGTGMIRVTLTAVPGRLTLLAAKAVTITAPVLVGGGVAVLGSLLAGHLLLPAHGLTPARGFPVLSLTDGPVLRAAVGSVLYLGLIGLLALGIGTAVRDTAASIGITLGLLYLFPIVAASVSDPSWHRHLTQLSPMTSGLTVQATRDLSALPIGPWTGLGVLAAWAAAALLAGGLVLRSRDA